MDLRKEGEGHTGRLQAGKAEQVAFVRALEEDPGFPDAIRSLKGWNNDMGVSALVYMHEHKLLGEFAEWAVHPTSGFHAPKVGHLQKLPGIIEKIYHCLDSENSGVRNGWREKEKEISRRMAIEIGVNAAKGAIYGGISAGILSPEGTKLPNAGFVALGAATVSGVATHNRIEKEAIDEARNDPARQQIRTIDQLTWQAVTLLDEYCKKRSAGRGPF